MSLVLQNNSHIFSQTTIYTGKNCTNVIKQQHFTVHFISFSYNYSLRKHESPSYVQLCLSSNTEIYIGIDILQHFDAVGWATVRLTFQVLPDYQIQWFAILPRLIRTTSEKRSVKHLNNQ